MAPDGHAPGAARPHAHPSLPGLADGQEAAALLPLPTGKHTMTRNTAHATHRNTGKPASVATQAPAAVAKDSQVDIYQRITDRIAAAIEAGAGKWQMPWHSGTDGAVQCLPVNAATGKPCRGINIVVLWSRRRPRATRARRGPPTASGRS